MSTSKPKLVYWDVRGLAEPIRFLLNYVGVDFKDVRIPFNEPGPTVRDQWLSQKYSHGLDFPNLPFYIDEDVKITQSLAILQHLGRKYNLYGDTLAEKGTIDMIAETVVDFKYEALVVYCHENFDKFKNEWKETFPIRFAQLEKFLEGKDFVLGSKISFVDFFLYEIVEWFRQFAPDVFERPELANLNGFQERIEGLPQIKKYMASDRFKSWPFFSAIMKFGYSKDPNFQPIPVSIRALLAKFPVD